MEVETTPWYETRSLISPQIEMLQEEGMVQYKASFLKKESPRYATLKSRFIFYNANYVKYCFLKEFYQVVFDGVRQEVLDNADNDVVRVIGDATTQLAQYCREQLSEENARELFRTFCKNHLFT
jgi:hypothetical protein